MPRLALFYLVFLLSGAPASAVLCDFVLCSPEPTNAAGCHEHETPGTGERVIAATRTCSHPLFVAPFVAPGHRQFASTAIMPAVTDTSGLQHGLAQSLADAATTRVPPPAEVLPRFQPLRI